MSELEGALERISLNPAKLWGLFKVGDKGKSFADWILGRLHFFRPLPVWWTRFRELLSP